MPTILIVTSNDLSDRLEKLNAESKEIQLILNSAPGKDYEVILVPDCSASDLLREFNVPGREIEVLHYAGHADSRSLLLADGQADAKALADRIKNLKTLKFVFLNGCATKGQVKYFHEAGVPFVLATSRKVGDDKALLVATQFYQYLTLRHTLQGAMDLLVKDDRLTRKFSFSNDRGFCLLDEDALDDDPSEWGLYPAPEAGDYNLPFSRYRQESLPKLSHTVFLEELVNSLDQLESPHLTGIRRIADRLEQRVDDEKITELLAALPYILGYRLQQIVADPVDRDDDYYRELLYDYAIFFETLLHYTLSLLSAKIWQEKERSFRSMPADIAKVREFLRRDRLQESPETYAAVLGILDDWLRETDAGSPLLLEKEQKDYLASEDFRTACGLFYLQKKYYWSRLRPTPEKALENCVLAQKHLCKAFHTFRFLARYNLASVRSINVRNFRHLPKDYENMVSNLIVKKGYPSPIGGMSMMENKSVLSFYEKAPAPGADSLNLFPFIIDRNVFTGKPNNEVDLYLFTGYFAAGEQGDCYHFISVNDPGKVWRIGRRQSRISLLHVGEEASVVHEQNHLMANASEFKEYLAAYHDQLLEYLQTA